MSNLNELHLLVVAWELVTTAASPQSTVSPLMDVYNGFVLTVTVRKMVMMCNFGYTDDEYEVIYIYFSVYRFDSNLD